MISSFNSIYLTINGTKIYLSIYNKGYKFTLEMIYVYKYTNFVFILYNIMGVNT